MSSLATEDNGVEDAAMTELIPGLPNPRNLDKTIINDFIINFLKNKIFLFIFFILFFFVQLIF